MLESMQNSQVFELNRWFRLVLMFSHNMIRRFTRNVSELKKMAARDYEDRFSLNCTGLITACLAVLVQFGRTRDGFEGDRLLRPDLKTLSGPRPNYYLTLQIQDNENLPLDSNMRYQIRSSAKHPEYIFNLVSKYPTDPAIKNFISNLRGHLLPHARSAFKITEDIVAGEETADQTVFLYKDLIYNHKIMQVNYTAYNASFSRARGAAPVLGLGIGHTYSHNPPTTEEELEAAIRPFSHVTQSTAHMLSASSTLELEIPHIQDESRSKALKVANAHSHELDSDKSIHDGLQHNVTGDLDAGGSDKLEDDNSGNSGDEPSVLEDDDEFSYPGNQEHAALMEEQRLMK
ncbi:hypothetical protein DXG01_003436 [Tephrocybe rancida]|nr:hypothetical protein DXG01_003436 [Tephrocybe rancida]